MTREDADEILYMMNGLNDREYEAIELARAVLLGDVGWEYIINAINKQYPEDLFDGNTDLGGKTIHALRCLEKERAALSGWVLLTRETAPTEPDETPFLVYMEGWFERPYDAVRVWTAGEIRYIPEEVIAYMPLPTLPEIIGLESTKTNGRGDAM